MVRSTAISWKISLAVAALASPLPQSPAWADDGRNVTIEKRPVPLEPKVVRVILLPPAPATAFTSWRPAQGEAAPIIFTQPAKNAATAQPLQEPVTIEDDPTLVESPWVAEQRQGVALRPPVTGAAIASARPEAAEPQKDTTPVVIPSLPRRSPFRQAAFTSEIVENDPKAAATVQQQAPEPVPAKSSSPFRFLSDLWPGNKRASTQATSTTEVRTSSAGDGKAGSSAPPAASASASIEQAENGTKSDKPPIKRLLDGIQFWKN